jgi:voltage-gated potassium channel
MSKNARILRSRRADPSMVSWGSNGLAQASKRALFLLISFISIHTCSMMYFEQLELWPSFWLTLTTLSTVGYGDFSPATFSGQLSTILFLYVGGITVVSFLVSDYIDYRVLKNERIRMGFWNWNMKNHIVIINAPKHNKEEYFMRLVSQIRETEEYEETPIQLLNMDFKTGLSAPLRGLGVVYTQGTASSIEDLHKISIQNARHIIVLARDEYSSDSDSLTFDVAHRLNDLHVAHKAIVECVNDENRMRLQAMGTKAILRPIRSYPELVVRAIDAPGSEVIIEDMFTRANDHPHRYPVWIDDALWADVVTDLVQNNIGIALGYVTKDGCVIANPQGDERVTAQSLLILVKTSTIPSEKSVVAAVSSHTKKLTGSDIAR